MNGNLEKCKPVKETQLIVPAYRAEIDGLRAIAVLIVVLFHAGFGFPGGFIGVDVFFVISGYLITSQILRELDQGHFSIAEFWKRRLRRIFPALAVVVGVCLLAGAYLMLPADLESLGQASLSQAVLGANIYFWRNVGYFAGPAETEALLHTWSLAVEEQFYLVFPLLIACLPRRWIVTGLTSLAVVSFAMSAYGAVYHPSAAFYLLPTRAWELLVGSLLAIFGVAATRSPSTQLMGALGLVGILAPALLYDKSIRFPGAAAMLPVFGAAAIIWSAKHSAVGKALSFRLFVLVGLISYSLYLWHWPILAFCRYRSDAPLDAKPAALAVAAAIIISALSWRFVEEPIRRRRVLASTSSLLATSAGVFLSIIVASAYIKFSGGLPIRLPASWRPPERPEVRADIAMFRADQPPILGDVSRSPTFIVWGDSHAGVALPVFDELGKSMGLAGVDAGEGGHPPIPGVKVSWAPNLQEWNTLVIGYIKKHNIPHVFLIARWSNYVEGASDYDAMSGRNRSGPLIARDPEAALVRFEREIKGLVATLNSFGCTVWIAKQVPDQNHDVMRAHFNGLSQKPGVTRTQFLQRQRRVERTIDALENDGVRVLDFGKGLFDAEGNSILAVDGVPLYRDSHHLSSKGVQLVIRPAIEEAFKSAFESSMDRPRAISGQKPAANHGVVQAPSR